jgi:transposase ISLasa14, IS3 family
MAKGTAYTQQFKEDAIRYKKEHPELSYQAAASNLNISISALNTWIKKSKENEGKVPTRGLATIPATRQRKSPGCSENFVLPRMRLKY